jgi:hypothetical protein
MLSASFATTRRSNRRLNASVNFTHYSSICGDCRLFKLCVDSRLRFRRDRDYDKRDIKVAFARYF